MHKPNPFSSTSNNSAEVAKSLLVHYLGNAGAGNRPDSDDHFAEISDLVDSIIQASVAEIKRQIKDGEL